MVSINLTLLIEVALFLIFLWGTARFVLRPVLRTLDKRERHIDQAHERAATETTEAEALERQYAQRFSEIRQGAEVAFRTARSETLKGHLEAVGQAREWADAAVAEARAKAMRFVDEERASMVDAVPAIADLIERRLHAGDPG